MWGDSQFASDEEEDEREIAKTPLDHIICLVDTRANMFELNAEEHTYFSQAMQVIHRILKAKIFESDKNMVGVMLLGTKDKTNEESPHDNIFDLIALNVPNARGIKLADRLAKGSRYAIGNSNSSPGRDEDDEDDDDYLFGGPMPKGETCPLKFGIWSCAREFDKACGGSSNSPGGSGYATKRIFLFTNDDDPLAGDTDSEEKVVNVVRDAVDSGVHVVLFPIGRMHPEAQNNTSSFTSFNVGRFYKRILVVDDDDNEFEPHSLERVVPIRHHEDLSTHIHKKIYRKRILTRLPLILRDTSSILPSSLLATSSSSQESQPTISIAMQLLITTSPTSIASITLDGQSNQVVTAQTRMLSDSTGEFLDQYDVRTYQEIGKHGERAYITKEEISQLKQWGNEPGIVLLGFVGFSWLEPFYHLRAPYFLYPDERTVKGSVVAAASLHKAMLGGARNVQQEVQIAICRFIRTAGTPPKLMALVPQVEVLADGEAGQEEPPGFHGIVLPFADDLRDLPLVTATTTNLSDANAIEGNGSKKRESTSEEVIGVKDTMFGGDLGVWASKLARESVTLSRAKVRHICNPSLQKQYHVLQALALDQSVEDSEWSEEYDDELRPSQEHWKPFLERDSGALWCFLKSLPDDTDIQPKRKAKSELKERGTTQKKAKILEIDTTGIDWMAATASGDLHSFKIADLKAFLRSRGLPLGGKKEDLVQRITDELSKPQEDHVGE